MFMKEDEARQKWCPHVRVEGSNRIFNVRTDGFENTTGLYHCIGSKCMAWRALHYDHVKPGAEHSLAQLGYCGLTGEQSFGE